MSTDGQPQDGKLPPELVELVRSLFGDAAPEAIAALEHSGLDSEHLMRLSGLAENPMAMRIVSDQVRQMMAQPDDGGPVNWTFAHDIARQASQAAGPDPAMGEAETRAVTEAVNVAELWLDGATEFQRTGGQVLALSSAEWIETTLPRWHRMIEPIVGSVADALVGVMTRQAEHAPEAMRNLAGAGATMLRRFGGTMFGAQVGRAIGTLSREVFGLTDIGLPLAEPDKTALLPTSIARFAEGLDSPLEEVRLFMAVREAAHARLFMHAPWLAGYLFGAVESYARGISIDSDRLEEAVRSIDPGNPTSLTDAMGGGVFDLTPTEAQQVALTRLETALALVEGWVDEVTMAAVADHLPDAAALREMMRRRRAAGGPAEHTFATLVGLQLRPRRARDAANLWAFIAQSAGVAARDALWGHPDLLPGPQDLDDPLSFGERRAAQQAADAAVDAALAELLSDIGGGGGAVDDDGESDPPSGQ